MTALSLTLFSTADMLSGRDELVVRMINSVAAYRSRGFSDVRLFILLQRCSPEAEQKFRDAQPDFVSVSSIPDRISLSAARNRLLRSTEARDRLLRKGIVGFPDDDCWYPDGTLDAISNSFRIDGTLDFWFCRYGMSPVSAGNTPAVVPRLQSVISFASSNTIFMRQDVVLKLVGFDELLGVGARLSGGEDTDYAIRAYQKARGSSFVDNICVGHRDPDQTLKAKYYPGSLRAIAKNTRARPSEIYALGRKLLVGCFLTMNGKLQVSDYMSAVAGALAR
jgi:hypothetical protein